MTFPMVALDCAARAPSQIRFNSSVLLIAGAFLGGICAAGLPLALLGTTYEGWSLATRTTDEFAGLLFLMAFLAVPLARLFPGVASDLHIDSRRLAYGFAAAYAVYLATATFAVSGEGQHLGVPQAAGIAIQFGMLVALVAAWGRVHTAALWFFWLAYTFAYAAHFSGPHIADYSFGVGLFLLLGALFLRFAWALKTAWGRSLAEKVG
jgi:hypothetical protein